MSRTNKLQTACNRGYYSLELRIHLLKGQLISKCLFCVLNSSKKRTKTVRLEVRQKLDFLCLLFGRIEDTKKTFRNQLTFSRHNTKLKKET